MPIAKRFEVVVVSKEFLKILEMMPEAVRASSVIIEGKEHKGPTERVLAHNEDEALTAAVQLAGQQDCPEEYTIIITERIGECHCCPGGKNDVVTDCPHMDRLTTINSPRYMNAAELLAKVKK